MGIFHYESFEFEALRYEIIVLMRNFKELLIWQKGMEIWKKCYFLGKQLPSEERYGLLSQISRASSSIPANIAEGSARKGNKDQSRFIQIALGSSFELETFLIGIGEMKLADSDSVKEILALVDEEQKMLISFQSKLKARG